jgi:hypothetical protein
MPAPTRAGRCGRRYFWRNSSCHSRDGRRAQAPASRSAHASAFQFGHKGRELSRPLHYCPHDVHRTRRRQRRTAPCPPWKKTAAATKLACHSVVISDLSRIEQCQTKAEDCEQPAEGEHSLEVRISYRSLADHWRHLAADIVQTEISSELASSEKTNEMPMG